MSFWQNPYYISILLVGALTVGLLLLMGLRVRGKGKRETAVQSPSPLWLKASRLLGFALLSFVVIGGGVMAFITYQSMLKDTAPARHPVARPADMTLPVEDVRFSGGDDLALAGWFVPPANEATIILLHGYGGDRTAMLWHAAQLVNAGYGVLLYDERASGESEGERRSQGWEDPADVGGALAYLNGRADVNPDKIGIAGCSIGAQIALQGAAYYPQIGAVWADGPSFIRAADAPRPNTWIMALIYVAGYLGDWMYTQRLDMAAPRAMIDIIGDIAPRPITLVAGGLPLPVYGPESQFVSRFASYAGENVEMWVIDQSFHCNGPEVAAEEYGRRLVAFFDAALAPTSWATAP